MIKIAIDGPGGAGKSSLARAVAKQMNIVYVDTGALYRTIALAVLRRGIDPKDAEQVNALLPSLHLEMRFEGGEQHIYLDGEDVNGSIRTGEISMGASAVSAIPEVRAFLLETQRDIAKHNSVIMDGRDIGTVIFPDADVKIFLTASPETRARRRYEELKAKGIDTTYEQVLAEMNERDKNDSTRAIAPAIQAEDAVLLDNSELTEAESVAQAIRIIRERTEERTEATPSNAEMPKGAQESQEPFEKKGSKELEEKRKGTKFYFRFHSILAGLVRFVMRLKPQGVENIPAEGGLLVCSNHIAFCDVFSISAVFPSKRRLRYMAKAELFRIPLLKQIITALGAYPVNRGGRDVSAIKKSLSILEAGEIVSLFPQGTRHGGEDPAKTEIHSGAGMIAYRAKVPVLPVCIKMKNMKYLPFRRVQVIIGRPIPYEALSFQKGGNEEYKRASQQIFDEICALGGFREDAE